MKHEDFPCCGCGPEGCIDTSRTVRCRDCEQEYHPDPHTEWYCYRCQAKHLLEQEGDEQYEEPEEFENECSCGSGKGRYELFDAQGIFCAFVCIKCEKKVKARYKPEVFDEDRYFDAVEEPLDDDY